MGYADVIAGMAAPQAVQPAASGKKTIQPNPVGAPSTGAIDPATGQPYAWFTQGAGGVSSGNWTTLGQTSGDMTMGGGQGGSNLSPTFNYDNPDWLKSIGWTGGLPMGWQGSPDSGSNQLDPVFQQYLDSKGLTLGRGYTGEAQNASRWQAFDASGNPVGIETQTKDPNEDAFGIGLLAAGAVVTGGAALGAAGATSGSADAGMALAEGAYPASITGGQAAAGAGGIAGTGVPEFSAYAGPGSTGYQVAGDVAVAPGATPTVAGEAAAAAGGGGGTGGTVADLSSSLYSDYAPVTGGGVGGPGTSILGSTGEVGTAGATMGAGAGAGGGGGSGFLGTGLSGQQVAQLGSSLYGIYQGAGMKSAAAGSDPFAPYRAGYAKQLSDLMANPSSVTSMPGYQASQQAAEQALTRNLASQGLTGSGAAAEALAKEGAQFQNTYYQQMVQTLAGLGGANINNAGISLAGQAAGSNTINSALNNLVKIWGATQGTSGGGTDYASIISSFFGSGG